MRWVLAGRAVGVMLCLSACLPDASTPSAEQLLASPVPVRVPLFTADYRGPVFALAGDATVPDRRDWRNLHVFRPDEGLRPPVSDRFLVRATAALGKLFVELGERVTQPSDAQDSVTLGVLSPGSTPPSWLSAHPKFQRLSLSPARFVVQTSDALVLGNVEGGIRKFGAARQLQLWGQDRLYFRDDDAKILFRTDGPDMPPVAIDEYVREFVVDRDGRFLSVHDDGEVFLGSPEGPVVPLVGLTSRTCDTVVLLEAASVVLCAQIDAGLNLTTFTRIDLVTGRPTPISYTAPAPRFFDVTVRHDLAAAYFHSVDQTWLVDAAGNTVVFPFFVADPLFTADHTRVVYATASGSGGGAGPRSLVVGNADFSGTPVPVGVESLSRYFDLDITEGKRSSHLVFMGESETGSTHLFTLRLGSPPGPVRRLATSVARLELRAGRVLALVDVSSQDRTGRLVEYDLDAGTERLVSAGVVDFASGKRCDGCGLQPETQVAYLVRTRLPDPMEGLWVAPLTP